MVSRVKTPLLTEAEERLGRIPPGGVAQLAQLTGLPVGRIRQIAKGLEPTGSARVGPAAQQVQRVVYELRRLQDLRLVATDAPHEERPGAAEGDMRQR